MARPQKQTVDYFPHDAHASQGTTLTILQHEFGNDGYAFWFKLLELLARTPGHVFDCRNSARWGFLQAITLTNQKTARNILSRLAELEAIEADLWQSDIIYSLNFVQRISEVYKNRHQEIPQKPVVYPNNPSVGAVSTPDNSTLEGVSIPDNPQSKLKESKLKESKEEEGPPTPVTGVSSSSASFEDLLNKNGLFPELATKFPSLDLKDELHKCSLWWSTSRKRVKSPELAFRNWLFKAIEIESERKVAQKERGQNGQGFNKSGFPVSLGEWDTGEVREV